MNKIAFVLSCLLMIVACNNNDSKKTAIDTTTTLSQTNNSVQILVDTLGNHADTAASKYEKGSSLITRSDCLKCHNVKEKNIGPSYVAVAEKYASTPGNVQHLASSIIKGSKGAWGEVPMTPHPTIPEGDATEMANYILLLNDIR